MVFRLINNQTGFYFNEGKVFADEEAVRILLMEHYRKVYEDENSIKDDNFKAIIDLFGYKVEPLLRVYYAAGTYAYYDGKDYYNDFGQKLKHPSEFDESWSETYKPGW